MHLYDCNFRASLANIYYISLYIYHAFKFLTRKCNKYFFFLVDMDRIGLNQSLFVANPDIKIFLVEVEGSLPDPDIPKGVSSILLIINNPPDKGDCKINATSGMALLDTFIIEFSNWDDKDGHYIADYSIYGKYVFSLFIFSLSGFIKILSKGIQYLFLIFP